MTGLHVYGALLLAMCFAIGGVLKDGPVVATALVAVALAALGEVLNEMNRHNLIQGRWRWLGLVAPTSWVMAAAAFVHAWLALFF